MDPAHNPSPTAWPSKIGESLERCEGLMASAAAEIRTKAKRQAFRTLMQQLQKFAAKLDVRLLPPASVPVVSPVFLADGPEPWVGTPEHDMEISTFVLDLDPFEKALVKPF